MHYPPQSTYHVNSMFIWYWVCSILFVFICRSIVDFAAWMNDNIGLCISLLSKKQSSIQSRRLESTFDMNNHTAFDSHYSIKWYKYHNINNKIETVSFKLYIRYVQIAVSPYIFGKEFLHISRVYLYFFNSLYVGYKCAP